jgi:hypothetical protein
MVKLIKIGKEKKWMGYLCINCHARILSVGVVVVRVSPYCTYPQVFAGGHYSRIGAEFR